MVGDNNKQQREKKKGRLTEVASCGKKNIETEDFDRFYDCVCWFLRQDMGIFLVPQNYA
jgi:hypothetical protein